MELDGLSALLDFLERMDYFTAQSSIHTSIIGCVKALMNNSVSLRTVLRKPGITICTVLIFYRLVALTY